MHLLTVTVHNNLSVAPIVMQTQVGVVPSTDNNLASANSPLDVAFVTPPETPPSQTTPVATEPEDLPAASLIHTPEVQSALASQLTSPSTSTDYGSEPSPEEYELLFLEMVGFEEMLGHNALANDLDAMDIDAGPDSIPDPLY